MDKMDLLTRSLKPCLRPILNSKHEHSCVTVGFVCGWITVIKLPKPECRQQEATLPFLGHMDSSLRPTRANQVPEAFRSSWRPSAPQAIPEIRLLQTVKTMNHRYKV